MSLSSLCASVYVVIALVGGASSASRHHLQHQSTSTYDCLIPSFAAAPVSSPQKLQS